MANVKGRKMSFAPSLGEFIETSIRQYKKSHFEALDNLTPDELAFRPGPKSMSIGFIAWHCARVHDFLVQSVMKSEPELWLTQDWATAFNRAPADPKDRGFGFSTEDLNNFETPSLSILLDYTEAVFANTVLHLQSLDDNGLSNTWVDSPAGGKFTLSTVYLQMIWEMNQHGGQMAYVRGMQKGIENPTKRSLIWDEAREQRS